MLSEKDDMNRPANASISTTGNSTRDRVWIVTHKALLLILVLGLLGTLGELVLLRHWGGVREIIPFVLVVVAVPVLIWNLATESPSSRTIFQVTMVAFLMAGVAGSWFHFTANIGHEQESNPGLALGAAVRLAIGGSTPTLAPGALIELGLVGLLLAFLRSHTKPGMLNVPKGF
jgi:hypothetical protein